MIETGDCTQQAGGAVVLCAQKALCSHEVLGAGRGSYEGEHFARANFEIDIPQALGVEAHKGDGQRHGSALHRGVRGWNRAGTHRLLRSIQVAGQPRPPASDLH
ncbi:hypothetical protein GCM10009784_14180 [Arthrobacter parietis]|uniref:Uncharacterized protein n=1 Tax=Arthrobacter parietis TaxID=271434 RepID=A0ABP5MJ79_9MICC